jgi:alkanesulfonate monooxygenase SsuD/methylene tetrahydromethanopterin reductase-like flavin-dependent oxidoreductase (luciferase family)
MARGFGVAGALDHEIVKELAAKAERGGFATFWANDTPNGDGLESLAAASLATSSIRLGVGVIPIDRKSAAEIIDQVKRLGLPEDRLTIGIGAGGLLKGSLAAIRSAAQELKRSLGSQILVGALGPMMVQLGAFAADGTLLNWVTTDGAEELTVLARMAALDKGRPLPHVPAYIRVAIGDRAFARLAEEAARYESYPQYKRHFDSMKFSAIETTIFGTEPESIQSKLVAYENVVNEAVVRAICAEETVDDYLSLLRATAPR